TVDNLLGRKDAVHVNGEFLHWLDADRGGPFFAFLNYMDVHQPYRLREEFTGQLSAKIAGDLPDPPTNTDLLRKLLSARTAYETSLAYLDQQIGALLDALEKRNLLERTLVVITSDHGEQFGEHGRWNHGESLYMQLLHVPLIVLHPGHIPTGLRIPEPASLANLPATILDLLHVP